MDDENPLPEWFRERAAKRLTELDRQAKGDWEINDVAAMQGTIVEWSSEDVALVEFVHPDGRSHVSDVPRWALFSLTEP